MSHFYANVSGRARTMATRCGTKYSGISSHTRGWHVGIKVVGVHEENPETNEGTDYFDVYLTGGSSNTAARIFIGRFCADDLDLESRLIKRDMADIIVRDVLEDVLYRLEKE